VLREILFGLGKGVDCTGNFCYFGKYYLNDTFGAGDGAEKASRAKVRSA